MKNEEFVMIAETTSVIEALSYVVLKPFGLLIPSIV